jgi:predicted N-acetyltransferase YhbS
MISYQAQGENLSSLENTSVFLNRVMKKHHFSSDYLKWQYFDNPVGNAIAICAYENDSIIGHYAAQPIISLIEGREIPGIFILNAAVDPSSQGKGVLRNIADRVHDQAARDGFRFMIGVGNRNSTPIYTKSFGFRLLGPLDVKVGFGIPKQNKATSYSYKRVWNDSLIKWRMQNPSDKYLINQKTEKTLVFKKNFFFLSTILASFNKLINHDILVNSPNYRLNLFIGNDPAIDWTQNNSFINFPNFAKPSPLNLIFKELQEDRFEISRANMLIRCIDFDAY